MDLPRRVFGHKHNCLSSVWVRGSPQRCTSRGQVTQPFLRKVKEQCVVRFHPGTVGSSSAEEICLSARWWFENGKKMACPSESPLSGGGSDSIIAFSMFWRFGVGSIMSICEVHEMIKRIGCRDLRMQCFRLHARDVWMCLDECVNVSQVSWMEKTKVFVVIFLVCVLVSIG